MSLCPVCHSLEELSSCLPTYFDAFDLGSGWGTDQWEAFHKLHWARSLHKHIEEGPTRWGALAVALPQADRRRLEATEALTISELEGFDGTLRLLDEWSLHWQLRDAAQAAEERDAAEPEEGFIYLKEEFPDWSSFRIKSWAQAYASGLHTNQVFF